MKRLWIVILGSLALTFGVSCGTRAETGSSDAPRQELVTQPTTGTARTTIYFLADDGAAPIGIRRSIRTKSPYAREALNALLADPTPDEVAQGITTAIPEGTRILSMTYERHGADETVDLSGLPPQNTLDPIEKARIITQIARTMIGVSGIERIWIEANGKPWGMTLMDGGLYSGPWGYDQLAGWDLGAGCPGTETVECHHFDALP
jgi:spore germination protein GerM